MQKSKPSHSNRKNSSNLYTGGTKNKEQELAILKKKVMTKTVRSQPTSNDHYLQVYQSEIKFRKKLKWKS